MERETTTVKQARAAFDLVACAALVPAGTQSLLADRDEDMTDLSMKLKCRREKVMIMNQVPKNCHRISQ